MDSDCLKRHDMVEYFQKHKTCHNKAITYTCGLDLVKYDHVIDIKNTTGIRHAFQNTNVPMHYLDSGWNPCLLDKSNGSFFSKFDTPHHSQGNTTYWKSVLCSNEVVRQVQLSSAGDFTPLYSNSKCDEKYYECNKQAPQQASQQALEQAQVRAKAARNSSF
jgi:hypothetical protein